ncbi:MAG: bacterioferritin [Firmicutes bacterium]|nr:bacterioferritin [Bacillota bacterium]
MNKNVFLLLDDYAGKVSELTAITQYFHHHLVVQEEDVAEVLERVALEEMRHLEMLGEALLNADIDPRIYNDKKAYWQGNYVNYQYRVCDILRADIQAELKAINQYYQHITAIEDKNIQIMLRDIIQDELRHIGMFSEKLAKYCPDQKNRSWLVAEIDKYPLIGRDKEQLIKLLRF